ncbi:hypothetical protein [Nocardia inohanensis]|uniref:hypothetical protein n=1 Tax=Nocardia inohanensis TaxID=209246 RepID=UPI00082FF58A|nr:hypothetical protein [Nocardia inohanensis]
MTVDEIANELYGIPPAEFVAVRTERAKQARDAGDKALAAAIGKLRRPTVAAWAVNLLARTAPDAVRGLLDLGDALRAAQQRLSGEQLRALTTQRQQVINALTRQAATAAASHGQQLNESTLRDVGSTLQAALADPSVAEQVRTGTVTVAASYEGFGPPILVAVPDESDSGAIEAGGPTTSRTGSASRRDEDGGKDTNAERDAAAVKDAPAGKGAARGKKASSGKQGAAASQPVVDPHAETRRDLEATLAELESARAELTSVEAEHDRAAAELSELDSRLASLRTELAHTEDRRRFTSATERGTRETARRARQQVAALERRAETFRNQLSSS